MYIPDSIHQIPFSELSDVQILKEIFIKQKENEGQFFTYQARVDALDKILGLINNNKQEILDAISKDYGYRCHFDTEILELYGVIKSVKYAKKNLKRWMKPQSVKISKWFIPGKAKIINQPKGVVGIIVPWNYPLLLSIQPLVDAISAGNQCMIKMSEITPHFSSLLKMLIEKDFPTFQIAIISGELPISQAFANLPFDHLFFTGSGAVGKQIMKAASINLTPVTLELGGKSPAIIHQDYPLEKAVKEIFQGKFYNSGQTCIAPDYILLSEQHLSSFIDLGKKCFKKYYPNFTQDNDVSNIINEHHIKRLKSLIEDAVQKGAQYIELTEQEVPAQKFKPGLLIHCNESMRITHEEIFGPILPIIPVTSTKEAIAYVNARPSPLALYYFDLDKNRINALLANTKSGGVTINDTLLHASQNTLPFGGIGASGMGKYHGKVGFETFSNQRSIFTQGQWTGFWLLRPPFGKLTRLITGVMQKYT